MSDELLDPESVSKLDPLAMAHVRSGAERFVFGEKLFPFAGRRVLCAQTMGLQMFSLAAEQLEALTDRPKEGMYPGLFFDALKVVWIATRTPSEVSKAILQPAKANEAVLDWADEHDITLGSEPFNQALEAFAACVEDIGNSTPKESAGGLGKDKAASSHGATPLNTTESST
jgi:hypothetical protein